MTATQSINVETMALAGALLPAMLGVLLLVLRSDKDGQVELKWWATALLVDACRHTLRPFALSLSPAAGATVSADGYAIVAFLVLAGCLAHLGRSLKPQLMLAIGGVIGAVGTYGLVAPVLAAYLTAGLWLTAAAMFAFIVWLYWQHYLEQRELGALAVVPPFVLLALVSFRYAFESFGHAIRGLDGYVASSGLHDLGLPVLGVFCLAIVSEHRAWLGSQHARERAEASERASEDQLRKSEHRYRALSELTSDMVYSIEVGTDGQRELEWVAGSLDATTVHLSSKADGRNCWSDLAHQDDLPLLERRTRRLLSGEASVDEIRIMDHAGKVHWLRLYGRPEVDQVSGRVTRIFGAAQDITERKEAEEAILAAKDAAELASRTKGEFLATMSHELRTPLNSIIGFAELMSRESSGPLGHESYKEFATDIHDSGRHLLEIINDILDVSKLEAGMVELVEEPVSLTHVLENCLRLMVPRAEGSGITLKLDKPDQVHAVRADERRLKQILVNLLSNAIKFTPAGGEVTVKLHTDTNEGILIQVVDTGIGIDPADLDQVMKPFIQVDSSLSRRHEGTGLGLPLCRALVERHGGSFEIESKPGIGTTASVRLPSERIIADAA